MHWICDAALLLSDIEMGVGGGRGGGVPFYRPKRSRQIVDHAFHSSSIQQSPRELLIDCRYCQSLLSILPKVAKYCLKAPMYSNIFVFLSYGGALLSFPRPLFAHVHIPSISLPERYSKVRAIIL